MKKARWIVPLLAALFLVPSAWAVNRVVDAAGNVYFVGVVELGQAPPAATALSYSVLHPNGIAEDGVVSPTEDLRSDREPSLVVAPGMDGPFMVWTRNDGSNDQIAFSRYSASGWSEVRYLTSGPRDHVRPEVGVDARGTAYAVWVEPAGAGSVVFATFDPATGNLLSSPRDLFLELVRHSPAQWLTSGHPFRSTEGKPAGAGLPGPLPEGGNDTPAIPPCTGTNTTNCKKDSTSGTVTVGPTCTAAAAAVVKNRGLWIGVLESGVVLQYYRATIPVGAPAGYVEMLLQTLLNQHCRQ